MGGTRAWRVPWLLTTERAVPRVPSRCRKRRWMRGGAGSLAAAAAARAPAVAA